MGKLHGETSHGSMRDLMETLKKMNSTLSPGTASQMTSPLDGTLEMMMTMKIDQEDLIQGVYSEDCQVVWTQGDGVESSTRIGTDTKEAIEEKLLATEKGKHSMKSIRRAGPLRNIGP
jgi:hypothetical protein